MLKTTFRKVTIASAISASLLLTGCASMQDVDSVSSPTVETTATSQAATPSQTKLPTTVPASTGDASTISSAKVAIDGITVKGRAPKTGYSRDQFGPAWADVDHNGCDTRNDILKRDLTDETFKDGTKQCVVATGVLHDPYTGKTINFVRGEKTSSAIQVDHLVALGDAFQKGAQQLSADQRKQLANDPLNLMAADGPTNGAKSDSDAASWLPPNTAFRCEYVSKQTLVKQKYNLWMTQAEKDAIKSVLAGC